MTIENKEIANNNDIVVSWEQVTNKPTRFNPSEHEHDIRWNEIIGKPSEFVPEYHTHDEYAKRYHKHTIEDIIGLEGFSFGGNDNPDNPMHNHDDRYYTKDQSDAILFTKADKDHTHDLSELTGLDDFLDCYKEFIIDKDSLIEDIDGFYIYQLRHDLDSTLLNVVVKNRNNKDLLVDITILSENRIEIFTCEKEDLKVLIKKISLT